MRLDRFIQEAGIEHKKAVRELIKAGRVTVNGNIVLQPYYEINEVSDVVEYNGRRVCYAGHKYYMFNKPSGCITANKDEKAATIFDYFPEEARKGMFAVGRLDKDTEGLLIVTNDGILCQKLMHPTRHVSKRYYFCAKGTFTNEDINKIESGVVINEGENKTKKAHLQIVQTGKLSDIMNTVNIHYNPIVSTGYLTITEGRKHQVKRMLMSVGCKVIYLKRDRIGELQLDEKLLKGQYRELTSKEIDILNQ